MELGWRQERMVAEAAEIADAAGTLHARFSKFLADFDKVGKRLTTAANAYDSAVGSMERRLLPQLRKVEELGVAPGQGDRAAGAGRDHGRARSPRPSCARPRTPPSAGVRALI